MTEINDCPFCHRSTVVSSNSGSLFFITCASCHAKCPTDKPIEKAIKAWNKPTDDIDGMTFNEAALRKDCARLRAELDEAKGVIR